MDNRKLNNLHVTIASLQGEYIYGMVCTDYEKQFTKT